MEQIFVYNGRLVEWNLGVVIPSGTVRVEENKEIKSFRAGWKKGSGGGHYRCSFMCLCGWCWNDYWLGDVWIDCLSDVLIYCIAWTAYLQFLFCFCFFWLELFIVRGFLQILKCKYCLGVNVLWAFWHIYYFDVLWCGRLLVLCQSRAFDVCLCGGSWGQTWGYLRVAIACFGHPLSSHQLSNAPPREVIRQQRPAFSRRNRPSAFQPFLKTDRTSSPKQHGLVLRCRETGGKQRRGEFFV